MITLIDVNKDNFRDVIRLEVREDQRKFVAHNMYSLAQAYVEKDQQPKAIYDNKTLVGFVMYDYNVKTKIGYISRLMIGKDFQGKGFGKQGMSLVLDDLLSNNEITNVDISYHPDNDGARHLYKKLGFLETGELDPDDGEVIARLKIK